MEPLRLAFLHEGADAFFDVFGLQQLLEVDFFGPGEGGGELLEADLPQALEGDAQHRAALVQQLVPKFFQRMIELIPWHDTVDQPNGRGFLGRQAAAREDHFGGPVVSDLRGETRQRHWRETTHGDLRCGEQAVVGGKDQIAG